jgi:NMD protein affecting ribosome stability and mRNA decay
MGKKKPSSARTERRAGERAAEKIARERERLAVLEDGGASARPIVVESASQVEVHARSMPCARCGHALRVDEHAAETVNKVPLRIARMSCSSCGSRRAIYFRIVPPLPN